MGCKLGKHSLVFFTCEPNPKSS
jgi:hypothetical protein